MPINNEPGLETSRNHKKSVPGWLLMIIPIIFVVGIISVVMSDSSTVSNRNCSEPRNPYSYMEPTIDASERYEGWNWREKGNTCIGLGKSISFMQGCKEYDVAESTYDECLR